MRVPRVGRSTLVRPLAVLLIATACAGRGSAPDVAPTTTRGEPSGTIIPTLGDRITSTPTAVPTPTGRPFTVQLIDAPGVPAAPSNTGVRYSDQVDRARTKVHQYKGHQRMVEVFVEQEGVLSPTEEKERAEWCFEVWLRVWEIFGGFAFPIYECVISDRLVPVGTAPSGHATWSRFPARALGPRVAETTWKSLISHEIVHSWNFGHIGIDELWFAEGMSEYYRWLVTEFENAGRHVASYYQSYVRQRGVGQDGPLAGATGETNANLAYYKGMLVYHMLDVEMSERSRGAKSLDNALRRLYLQVGTQGIPPGIRPPPLPRSLFRDAIVAEVGGAAEINRFFADYVEGTRDLAEWRDGRLKLPVAPIPSHPPVAY